MWVNPFAIKYSRITYYQTPYLAIRGDFAGEWAKLAFASEIAQFGGRIYWACLALTIQYFTGKIDTFDLNYERLSRSSTTFITLLNIGLVTFAYTPAI
jgi:hypothetical protein